MQSGSAQIDSVELSAAPRVTLGGKSYAIPALAVRQNKRIAPLVFSIRGADPRAYDEAQMEALFQIVYIALTRAYPELARDEFDNLPITFNEVLAAFTTIMEQAGMVAAGKKTMLPPETAMKAEANSIGKPLSSKSRGPKAGRPIS